MTLICEVVVTLLNQPNVNSHTKVRIFGESVTFIFQAIATSMEIIEEGYSSPLGRLRNVLGYIGCWQKLSKPGG